MDTWIGSARLDGTDVRQRQLVLDEHVSALAPHGHFLFIATPERVERARLGARQKPRVLARGININSLAVGGTYLYWGDDGLPVRNQPWHGTIHRADLNGSHPRKFRIPGLQQPACLTLAGPYLFWCDFEAKRIGRVGLDGSGARTVIETSGSPVGLALYGNALYWGANANGGPPSLQGIGMASLDSALSPIEVDQSLLDLDSIGEDPISLALG